MTTFIYYILFLIREKCILHEVSIFYIFISRNKYLTKVELYAIIKIGGGMMSTVTDLAIQNKLFFQRGTYNIIDCGVRTGKTYWAVNNLQ